MHPIENPINIPSFVDPETLARETSQGYLPSVAGVGHSWTCLLNEVEVAEIRTTGIEARVQEISYDEHNRIHYRLHVRGILKVTMSNDSDHLHLPSFPAMTWDDCEWWNGTVEPRVRQRRQYRLPSHLTILPFLEFPSAPQRAAGRRTRRPQTPQSCRVWFRVCSIRFSLPAVAGLCVRCFISNKMRVLLHGIARELRSWPRPHERPIRR